MSRVTEKDVYKIVNDFCIKNNLEKWAVNVWDNEDFRIMVYIKEDILKIQLLKYPSFYDVICECTLTDTFFKKSINENNIKSILETYSKVIHN